MSAQVGEGASATSGRTATELTRMYQPSSVQARLIVNAIRAHTLPVMVMLAQRHEVRICGAENHLWGVAHMSTESTFTGQSRAQDVPNGDRPTGRSAGAVSRAQGDTGSAGWANNLHIGALVFGGVSSILVVLRLLSVAKANPETAYGILQAGGTTDVIIGTVLSLIPSIALIGSPRLSGFG